MELNYKVELGCTAITLWDRGKKEGFYWDCVDFDNVSLNMIPVALECRCVKRHLGAQGNTVHRDSGNFWLLLRCWCDCMAVMAADISPHHHIQS